MTAGPLPLPDLGRVGGVGEGRVVRSVAAARSGGTNSGRNGEAKASSGASRNLRPRRRSPARRSSINRSRRPAFRASVLGRVGKRPGWRPSGPAVPPAAALRRPPRDAEGDLAWLEDGEVVSARVSVLDIRVRRRSGGASAHDRGLRGRDGDASRRRGSGAATSSSGSTREIGSSSREAEALRAEADPRQPGLPARGQRGRAPPRRADRPGLPADRRADRGDAPRAVRDALDRAGAAYPEYLPEALREEAGVAAIGGAVESPLPDVVRCPGRGLDRLAFDELLALQLGMVGRAAAAGARFGTGGPSRSATRSTPSCAAPSRVRSAGSSTGPSR